jgi:hypothetical protein
MQSSNPFRRVLLEVCKRPPFPDPKVVLAQLEIMFDEGLPYDNADAVSEQLSLTAAIAESDATASTSDTASRPTPPAAPAMANGYRAAPASPSSPVEEDKPLPATPPPSEAESEPQQVSDSMQQKLEAVASHSSISDALNALGSWARESRVSDADREAFFHGRALSLLLENVLNQARVTDFDQTIRPLLSSLLGCFLSESTVVTAASEHIGATAQRVWSSAASNATTRAAVITLTAARLADILRESCQPKSEAASSQGGAGTAMGAGASNDQLLSLVMRLDSQYRAMISAEQAVRSSLHLGAAPPAAKGTRRQAQLKREDQQLLAELHKLSTSEAAASATSARAAGQGRVESELMDCEKELQALESRRAQLAVALNEVQHSISTLLAKRESIKSRAVSSGASSTSSAAEIGRGGAMAASPFQALVAGLADMEASLASVAPIQDSSAMNSLEEGDPLCSYLDSSAKWLESQEQCLSALVVRSQSAQTRSNELQVELSQYRALGMDAIVRDMSVNIERLNQEAKEDIAAVATLKEQAQSCGACISEVLTQRVDWSEHERVLGVIASRLEALGIGTPWKHLVGGQHQHSHPHKASTPPPGLYTSWASAATKK